jgi:hypothetical protein
MDDRIESGPQPVFLIGCPRSGTTWLQLMLSSHPAISSSQETHLFDYIGALDEVWDRHSRSNRSIGLPFLLSGDAFAELERDMCRRIFAQLAQTPIYLEKTPGHALHIDRIVKLFPAARFIHLVRDPRAAVASIIRAGRDWAGPWASPDSGVNAQLWRRSVEQALDFEQRQPERILRLEYGALRREPAKYLSATFEWLGLPADEALVARIIEENSLDRVKQRSDDGRPFAVSAEPAGFYGKGEISGWQKELSAAQIADVEEICHDLMSLLGYETVATAGQRRRARQVARMRAGWNRTLRAAGRRLRAGS